MKHQHNESVKAECNACMRRCTILECIKKESEFLLSFFFGNSNCLKYLLLQIFLIDTEASAAGFDTIENHVVSFSIYLGRISGEILNVFITRCSERMMFSYISMFFFAVFKHREIGNPAEAEFVRINQIHSASHFKAQFAQSLSYYLRLISNNKDQIAKFCFAGLANFSDFFFAEEFGNLAFQAAVVIESDPCKALCAISSNIIDKSV